MRVGLGRETTKSNQGKKIRITERNKKDWCPRRWGKEAVLIKRTLSIM